MNDAQNRNEHLDFNRLSLIEIKQQLKQHQIRLTVDEALRIQNDILFRPPTITECLLWSIQGSEHCSYKSSKTFLKQLPVESPNVILGPGEDAGVVAVAKDNQGHRYGIAMSHESHNHPSQIVPFEGAATGVGGNVRDVACMGATVIALAESLRFGALNENKTHWLRDGVIAGISAYGNALGVPNIAGDVYYHKNYQDNCLVTVVTLGVVREDRIIHSYVPDNAAGYDIILVGKATDNSGFGGASFASSELEETNNRGAVQEPNAFLGRHLLKSGYALIEKFTNEGHLSRVAFKDLGAGGIACAAVEIADGNGYGCVIDLDQVHLGMEGLHPGVILCAETQERFIWAVPHDLTKMVLNHYNQQFALPQVSSGAEARVIGKITKDTNFKVTHQGSTVVHALASDVTAGLTVERLYKSLEKKYHDEIEIKLDNMNEAFLTLLSSPNIRSQYSIYCHYDKQVQGRTIIERGRAEAGVIQVFNDDSFPDEIKKTGVALAVSHNPNISLLCPYTGAISAVATCLEKVASVGASPQAITDCLCFGSPEKEAHMWEFVEATRAIGEACQQYHLIEYPEACLPVIAGNVSFYNKSKENVIPASPIISCLGRLTDVGYAIDSGFKASGNRIIKLSPEAASLSGSALHALYDGTLSTPVAMDMNALENRVHFICTAINQRLILACQPIHDGGLGTALAKMSLLGGIGCAITIDEHAFIRQCFAETGGFVFEVREGDYNKLLALIEVWQMVIEPIGITIPEKMFYINQKIRLSLTEMQSAWGTFVA